MLDVSLSGFYAWKKRPLCPRKREDGEISARIQVAFELNRGVYGSPRIHAELRDQGIHCRRKRVVRFMQALELSARRPVRHGIGTRADAHAAVAPHLLARDFTAQAPNQKWVTDITSIATVQGWLYLSVVLDLFSRAIVGWAMSAHPDMSSW